MMTHKYLVCLLLVVLAGCSASDGNQGQVRENVFDTQIKAVDKAKAVEQQVMDAAARQRQIIKEQGG